MTTRATNQRSSRLTVNLSPLRIRRAVPVSVALVIICTEAALKGWFVFFTLPSLLVTVPVIVILQSLTANQLKRQAAHPLLNRVVHAQLVGVVLCYACLAGFSDTAAWWIVPSMIVNETFADVMNTILLFFLAPVCIGLTLIAIVLLCKGAPAQARPPRAASDPTATPPIDPPNRRRRGH